MPMSVCVCFFLNMYLLTEQRNSFTTQLLCAWTVLIFHIRIIFNKVLNNLTSNNKQFEVKSKLGFLRDIIRNKNIGGAK